MLPSDEIHIHLLRLGRNPAPPEDFLSRLSGEERVRYGRFELESRRREFLWSRLLVRRVLAPHLGRAMAEVPVLTGQGGKPRLEGDALCFNLSHTDGLVACCFAAAGEVGIDVERIDTRKRRHWPLVARRFFSREEQAYLSSSPAGSQPEVFFGIFTRKEAVGKARGWGAGLSWGDSTVPLPLRERSGCGPLRYFAPGLLPGYRLAQATLLPAARPGLRYRVRCWDETSLERDLLEGGPAEIPGPGCVGRMEFQVTSKSEGCVSGGKGLKWRAGGTKMKVVKKPLHLCAFK